MANLKWRSDLAKKVTKEAGMRALLKGAEAILTESIDETPVLSGTLRRSGSVTDSPAENAVYVSYNTPYAVRQHEELSYQHPLGGKAKYLEDPFNRLAGKVHKMVDNEVKKDLRNTP